ncbi:hypothetical protein EON83_13090 [bacterium]|nr:MAG: hypothetical protein EON83_13090 [bacterium]
MSTSNPLSDAVGLRFYNVLFYCVRLGHRQYNKNMEWNEFDNGASIGQRGSEGGIIVHDVEHSLGARSTLEQGGGIAPFSITCGIYGWMFHTRFFSSQQEAEAEYEHMKDGLADILNIIPLET